jgi:hypothetical protein
MNDGVYLTEWQRLQIHDCSSLRLCEHFTSLSFPLPTWALAYKVKWPLLEGRCITINSLPLITRCPVSWPVRERIVWTKTCLKHTATWEPHLPASLAGSEAFFAKTSQCDAYTLIADCPGLPDHWTVQAPAVPHRQMDTCTVSWCKIIEKNIVLPWRPETQNCGFCMPYHGEWLCPLPSYSVEPTHEGLEWGQSQNILSTIKLKSKGMMYNSRLVRL